MKFGESVTEYLIGRERRHTARINTIYSITIYNGLECGCDWERGLVHRLRSTVLSFCWPCSRHERRRWWECVSKAPWNPCLPLWAPGGMQLWRVSSGWRVFKWHISHSNTRKNTWKNSPEPQTNQIVLLHLPPSALVRQGVDDHLFLVGRNIGSLYSRFNHRCQCQTWARCMLRIFCTFSTVRRKRPAARKCCFTCTCEP